MTLNRSTALPICPLTGATESTGYPLLDDFICSACPGIFHAKHQHQLIVTFAKSFESMGFFPTDYKRESDASNSKSEPNPKYFQFDSKNLKDGESISFRPCGQFESGHVVTGFQYFTKDGNIRRFSKYPTDYSSDIGLTYAAKNATGKELDDLIKEGKDKDRPKQFLSFVAIFPDRKDFVCVTILQKTVRALLEDILDMEDYIFLPSDVANFTLTAKRKGEKIETTYTLAPVLKVPSAAFEKKWEDAKDRIWLPALYEGADPFDGKPDGGKTQGLPPSRRDELGADHEVATTGIGEDW